MPKDCPDPNVFCFAVGHGYRFRTEANEAAAEAKHANAPRRAADPGIVRAQFRAQKAQMLRALRALRASARKHDERQVP